MSKSTGSQSARKPVKPYPDFPLSPHASGRWAKKICQKLHYFGKVADDADFGAMAALELYQKASDLHAGRPPRPATDGLTLRELTNSFLTVKRNKANTGELGQRIFAD